MSLLLAPRAGNLVAVRPQARARRLTVRNVTSTKTVVTPPNPSKTPFTASQLIKVGIPDAIYGDDNTKNVTADICYPQANGSPAQPKGVVVFMHGFSQLPVSYDTTIQELAAEGFFVIAPYGGREAAFGDASVFSPKVQQLVQDRAAEKGFSWNPFKWFAELRYATQLALQQEGLQCVTYVTGNTKNVMLYPEGDKAGAVPLSVYLPKPFKQVGLCGHSMGGGLCFSVAAERPAVSCIGVMAPMPALEDPFKPVSVISKSTFTNKTCRLLSGALDFLVFPSQVEEVERAIEAAASRGNKSTYEKLPWFFHTSFEDELTLEDLPLTAVLGGALVALNLLVDSQLGDGSWVETALKVGSGTVFAALVWLLVLRPRFQQSVARDQMRDFFNQNL